MVESPCVDRCALDEEGVCLGCGRTMAEIRRWASLSTAERRAVVDRVARE
ncbi:MAG: DUF1289 domain-containing protein [Halobellus sp.]